MMIEVKGYSGTVEFDGEMITSKPSRAVESVQRAWHRA